MRCTSAQDEYADRFANGDPSGGAWQKGEAVTMPDDVLQFDGRQAQSLGFARYVVDNFEELNQLYQLKDEPAPDRPELGVRSRWMRSHHHSWLDLLLFIGSFALMSELSSPGLRNRRFSRGRTVLCLVFLEQLSARDGRGAWRSCCS